MAKTLWTNATFVTMDSSRPRARALVVSGEELEFVGDESEARIKAGPGAVLRDLGGRTVVPGFNDNHVHAVILGDHYLAPNLSGLDEAGIMALLKERWAGAPPGRILTAYSWDYPSCPKPRKEILDAAFPRNPVSLSQFSGHAQWMNSLALQAIGIRRGGPDPANGEVLRDPDGDPTGIVRDLGDTALSRKRFRRIFFNRELREERLGLALDTFKRYGITSVQDNSWFYPVVGSLARLRRRGKLTARFGCWSLGRQAYTTPAMRASIGLLLAARPSWRDWIRAGPVKFFLDGAFSTRTACLSENYADSPTKGGLCVDEDVPEAELEMLASHRFQGAFHAIGDRAVGLFLDAVEAVAARHPNFESLRMRIEHGQLIQSRDIGRLRKLGVLVSAQPSALGSPGKDENILGRERAERAYPYRSLLDAGVHLSFGSDIPGEATCDPLLHIHMAVNRSGPERIGVEEALRCYTVGSAYAEFMEGRKGALKPGMLADFVVLSRDLTTVPPSEIRDIMVEETVVGGTSVYRREEG